ncbi:MAG: NUDIX hydrolase [Actinobacteria bacterium]|nr:NUDIX hydrolase [Actinomycetota bacterium]MBS1885282.1 NUDIX hydrolase [Actinomycetota bacterium]
MERRRGPAEAPNHGTPATPRPAASIVLLRRGGKHGRRALEVLLLKRTEKAAFMPGAWVFPGGSVDPEDGEGADGFRACAVRELREEAGIELPAGEELVPFCRWITPEIVSRRFDAWFFLALAPAHTPPQVDGGEVVEARWFEPAAAIEAAAARELVLPFPTRTQLGWLAAHPTSEAALAAYRGCSTEPILPELVGEGDDQRLVLPGLPDSILLSDLRETD